MSLSNKSCTPCQGGIAPLTRAEAEAYLRDTPGWLPSAEATRIEADYRFKNFAQALTFVNAIGKIAEAEGHHPDIHFGWGYCNVVLYTHKIKGLHENDFIVAAKFNDAYERLA